MHVSKKHRFKNGKYADQPYFQVWEENPDYFYWMAAQFGSYWENIVKQLEQREKTKEKSRLDHPSVERVKQIFLSNFICGFDMSDYICEIYSLCPDNQKNEYFQSLVHRNKIKQNEV